MEVDLVTLIGQVGFPIAVAAYLLIRVDKTMKELAGAVSSLSAKVGELVIINTKGE